MKKNIIAILHHCVHLKDPKKKQHWYCPHGESSWCKWQQDQSSGTSTYECSDCLPEVFLKELTPIFLALSEQKLLERCVRGATQNPNECLNSLVWAWCHKYHGIKFVFTVLWPQLSVIFTVVQLFPIVFRFHCHSEVRWARIPNFFQLLWYFMF